VDKAEGPPPPLSGTAVAITDGGAELSLLRGHLRHRYFFDTLTRRWEPLNPGEGPIEQRFWAMSKEYVQKLSDSEVLMARGGAFLMDFWVVLEGGRAQEVAYLPADVVLSHDSAKRFGVVVKLASHFPVVGIWPLERDSYLQSLSTFLNRGPPYPDSAPLEENTVIRIESEPKASGRRDAKMLRRAIVACNGYGGLIPSEYRISVTKSFFLRITKEPVRPEHYQIANLGTVLYPVPCPLVEWSEEADAD
jgi:hypothetical protein